MITEKTVFIIGAGASVPYGYPTAEKLRKKIINNKQYWIKLLPMSWQPTAEKFVDVFDKSDNKSIDLFLSRNSEFKNVGKFAIVNSIIDDENASYRARIVRNESEDWYSYLFQEMTKELLTKTDLDKFADNKVTFITFNYDRYLEFFLAESLANSFYGIDRETIFDVLRKINIFHVYGQVAPLLWQNTSEGIEYGCLRSKLLMDIHKNIHVIGEERQDLDTFLKQSIIKEAKKIFFLGFGFRKENLDILKLPDILLESHQIFSSGIGWLKEEIINLRRNLSGGAVFPGSFGGRPAPQNIVIEAGVSCLDILRKYLFLSDQDYLNHLAVQACGYNC